MVGLSGVSVKKILGTRSVPGGQLDSGMGMLAAHDHPPPLRPAGQIQ